MPPTTKKTSWPAETVELRPISELHPYARNARKHSAHQVEQIAASIKEWGWTVPVLVDEDGLLIAGHGRILAAKKLGIDKVPVMTATGWTTEQKRAYALADNQLVLNSEWDENFLRVELDELTDAGFDMSLIGFDEPEEVEGADPKASGILAEVFGVPPFTVLNAREGWWQDRKRAWIALGIKSELGRAGGK